VAVYALLTPQKLRVAKIMAVGIVAIALVGTYIALARSGVTNQSQDSTATTVGVIANVASFVMYSSPFETIARVVRTKNASSMPIHLCLVGAIGNTAWVIYAVLVMDIIILVPNVVCSLVGWVQVVMYWVYRPGRFTTDVATNSDKPMDTPTSPMIDMSLVIESPDVSGAFNAASTPSHAV
jgi:solute carrier family 50 protein (sugar transporter)